MEKSKMETLKEPSLIQPSAFGSHRRRPLRSETFDTLIRILSHCYAESQHSQDVSESPNLDNGDTGIGPATKHDGSLARTKMVPDELLLQKESLVDEGRDDLGNQEGGLNMKHMEIDGYDNNILGGRMVLARKDNTDLLNLLGNKSQNGYGITVSTSNLEYQFSAPQLHTEEFTGQIEVDRELSNHEVNDAIDPPLGVNKIVRNLNPSEDNNKKIPHMERNALEEVKDEKQCTGKESVMNYFSHLTADTEAEEGEISGEFMAFLPEDDISCVEKTRHEVHSSEEVISNNLQTGFENDIKSIPLSVDTINNVGKSMEAVARENKRNLVDYSEIFVHGKTVEAVKLGRNHCNLEGGWPANLPQFGGVSGDNATKIQDLVSTKKDAGARNNKKRQGTPTKEHRTNKKVCSLHDEPEIVVHGKSVEPVRGIGCILEDGRNKKQGSVIKESIGPSASQEEVNASTKKDDSVVKKKKERVLTKERRAKKKQKERIKRAEMNKKLGVKRLKLQPVLKPKTVTFCRHYLKGRCQEGEKCKFSHDTVPLTKSKPCCHFARHSCMKGDDCPFDHQLSKYPCNNYLSKGFCSRGADCMFSHEMQASEGSLNASIESRPELKSLSPLDNSSSKKQLSINGPSGEKVDTKSCSMAVSPCKSTVQNFVATTPKLAVQAPKGMSFLLLGKSSLEVGSFPKVGDGVKIDHSASNVVQNSNEITRKTPVVTPRGINFLSFGKKPLFNDSNSNLSFKRDSGIGKSPFSNSSLNRDDDDVKCDNRISQSASTDSSKKKEVGHYNQENAFPIFVQEKDSGHDKFQIPNATAIPSSSFSNCPFSDLMADRGSKITPSLSQKSFLLNTPSSLHKALQSTLAFASKFESGVKMVSGINTPVAGTDFSEEAGTSTNKSMKASISDII